MKRRRLSMVSVTIVTMLALLLSGSLGAGLSSAHAAGGQRQANLPALNTPGSDVMATLPLGASGIAGTVSGHQLYWNKTDAGMVLSVDTSAGTQPVTNGWGTRICLSSLTAAVWGLGAAGLALLAVSGGGVIAGVFISAELAGAAAAVAGSFSAIYGVFAAAGVCG